MIDVEKIVRIIREKGYKKVVLQFPDGLKPLSTKIAKQIEKETGAEVYIWMSSCYGPCDVPVELFYYDFDALFHIGHCKIKNEA